ncbi:hypothetical protein PSTG_14259 [Puccinia striiformis f. sp. tritici PST-78]|uniref:Uncharacterized protein n=1 Tax=Puccinia striiformis f. sp. tritici PST-78 TaxID=1165861 RepID=A0A0L0UZA9_9BASI|nr:hypothetical protein PSTG_14259 [Puccinia striiformis f. sp. tritici PST-78]
MGRETPEPITETTPSSETSNPTTPIPNPSTSGNPETNQNSPEPNTAKPNPTRKGRITRAAAKQQEKTPTTSKSGDPIDPSQIAVQDIAAALGNKTHKPTTNLSPSYNQTRDKPSVEEVQEPTDQIELPENEEVRARQAKYTLDKAFKAQEDGDEHTATIFFDIHHSLLPPTQASKNLDRPRPTVQTTIEPFISKEGPGAIMPMKRRPTDGKPTEVRNLRFKWGTSNDHSDGGFAPYFHKNILELKGPIPLTIFNRAWQARALLWHSANHSSSAAEKAENSLRYYGLAVPDKYAQSHSEWTLNYGVFHVTMKISYKYETLTKWILLHKANCDQMLSKDGFMVALRYDIKMRTNAWQFKPMIDGVEYVSDFSEVRQDTYEEAYSEARANRELIFKTVNLYAIGGPREKWEAAPGTPPVRTTAITQTPKVTAQLTPTNQSLSLLPTKPNPGKQQPNSNPGYQGSNYNLNFRNRSGRGQGGGPHEYNHNHVPSVAPELLSNTPGGPPPGTDPNHNEVTLPTEQPELIWPEEVSCEMDIERWKIALKENDLLPEFNDVIEGFTHGFHQGIPDHDLGKAHPYFTPPNHKSALLAREKIEETITKELVAKRMYGPYSKDQVLQRFGFFRTNPLGATVNNDGTATSRQ